MEKSIKNFLLDYSNLKWCANELNSKGAVAAAMYCNNMSL